MWVATLQGRTPEEVSKIISRGRDAYQDFTLVNSKIDQFKSEALRAFENTTPLQDTERRNLWQAIQIAEKVRSYLQQDIEAGKHAIKQVEEIKKVGKPSIMQRVLP